MSLHKQYLNVSLLFQTNQKHFQEVFILKRPKRELLSREMLNAEVVAMKTGSSTMLRVLLFDSFLYSRLVNNACMQISGNSPSQQRNWNKKSKRNKKLRSMRKPDARQKKLMLDLRKFCFLLKISASLNN
ncbi:CLUMA_CG003840, isoform A [Clunio marinus]|uniref:CLUMA_CG003840, isoform A n=1 Tax=Clunio marinus TaxID=568069 RepID=A0A1J1HRG5_9DIPT|nr:CLUMA_CG003840, isoform A [Clunio marinus]